MKKVIFRVVVVAAVLLAGWLGYGFVKKMPDKKREVAVTKVRQGDVVIRAFTRGELRAVRSETLVAPNLNATVQVTRLAPLGAFAREKDLIVEFDDSEVLSRMEETELGLQSTDENIKQREAELAIRNNQDQVDLLKYRYAVRRAELQVQRNPLLGAIDAKKNVLALEEAKQRLAQFEGDIQGRREQAEAQLALLRQQRQRNAIELARDQQRLRQTKLLASMSGIVSIRQNVFGGARQFGAQAPDIREGDQVQPGMPIADILDLSEMELVAKVGELDRANLMEGQEAIIRLDALAGKPVRGKIKSLSSTASANVMAGDPSKKFDVLFSIDMEELLKAVGATPQQIREIMATAERNRDRAPTRSALPAGAMEAMFNAMAGAGAGGNGMPAFGGPMPAFGMQVPGARGGAEAGAAGRRRGGAEGGAPAPQGERGARGGQGGEGFPGRGGRGEGGFGGFGGFGGRGGPSDEDLKNAKLPAPPDEESGLQILLRPGLLADVEIIVEKIPNAIHIPAQAVFDKDGRPVVYVQTADGTFQERPVKILKRSESTMVISEGLRAGELIALSDPTEGAGGKKKQEKKAGGGASPVGAVSGGPGA
ncbi:MAG: efflux RND transporter periplasmic adaptor subunit [Bryobacteraceae bacterium]|nr:efflux RND transporter periplasmic adaptor subunit [Bryobacteraceae bacterium]